MSFKDILGHKDQILLLQGNLDCGKLAHAYLFLGPDGIGKKLTALNFTKALNCLEPENNQRPCDKCRTCKRIDADNFPDLFILKPKAPGSSIGIEKMRQIKKDASLKPYEGRYKIFIIDEASAMTHEAQNAMLKMLEEPCDNTLFILIASALHRILSTVSSRCRVVRFDAGLRDELVDYLVMRHRVRKEEAVFIAAFSGGRIGEAVNLKESGFFDKKNVVIKRLLESLKKSDRKDMLRQWALLDRYDFRKDMEIALSWFRDMYIWKTTNMTSSFLNSDRSKDIMHCADNVSLAELEKMMERIITLDHNLSRNANQKLVTDVFLSELGDLKGDKACMK